MGLSYEENVAEAESLIREISDPSKRAYLEGYALIATKKKVPLALSCVHCL